MSETNRCLKSRAGMFAASARAVLASGGPYAEVGEPETFDNAKAAYRRARSLARRAAAHSVDGSASWAVWLCALKPHGRMNELVATWRTVAMDCIARPWPVEPFNRALHEHLVGLGYRRTRYAEVVGSTAADPCRAYDDYQGEDDHRVLADVGGGLYQFGGQP